MIGLVKSKLIIDYLNELFLEIKTSVLYYNKDYEYLIAVMLSANAKDNQVNKVTPVLFGKYNTIELLNNADIEDIKIIIRSVGSYNKKSFYIKEIVRLLISKYDGTVPNNREFLESLPGIGRKTVNVVFNELFDGSNIAVDTHVNRVSKRLGLAEIDDSVTVIEEKLYKIIPVNERNGMALRLVLFGRHFCKARKPLCGNCKLKSICKFEQFKKD